MLAVCSHGLTGERLDRGHLGLSAFDGALCGDRSSREAAVIYQTSERQKTILRNLHQAAERAQADLNLAANAMLVDVAEGVQVSIRTDFNIQVPDAPKEG